MLVRQWIWNRRAFSLRSSLIQRHLSTYNSISTYRNLPCLSNSTNIRSKLKILIAVNRWLNKKLWIGMPSSTKSDKKTLIDSTKISIRLTIWCQLRSLTVKWHKLKLRWLPMWSHKSPRFSRVSAMTKNSTTASKECSLPRKFMRSRSMTSSTQECFTILKTLVRLLPSEWLIHPLSLQQSLLSSPVLTIMLTKSKFCSALRYTPTNTLIIHQL